MAVGVAITVGEGVTVGLATPVGSGIAVYVGSDVGVRVGAGVGVAVGAGAQEGRKKSANKIASTVKRSFNMVSFTQARSEQDFTTHLLLLEHAHRVRHQRGSQQRRVGHPNGA